MRSILTLTFLTCCLHSSSVLAQAYWQVFEDSTFFSTSILQMCADNNGNVYTMGQQPEELYTTEYFIDKKDSLGNTLWKADVAEKIQTIETADNGTTFALLSLTGADPEYETSFFLRAYTTDGDTLWEKPVNIPGLEFQEINRDDEHTSLAVDIHDNVILAMYAYNFNSDLLYHDDTFRVAKFNGATGALMKKGYFDPLEDDYSPEKYMSTDTKGAVYIYTDQVGGSNILYKFNKNMVLQWQVDLGGYSPDKMEVYKDKAIFFVDDKDSGSSWDSIEVRKYNAADGSLLYMKTYAALEYLGSSSNIQILDAAIDSKGKLLVSYVHTPGVLPTYLLKIKGTNGDLLFNQQIESEISTFNTLPFINVRQNDEIILSGVLSYSGNPVVYKYSKLGSQIWEHSQAIDGTVGIAASTMTSANQVILGGNYSSFLYEARHTLSFQTNLTEKKAEPSPATIRQEIFLYPNPTADKISIATGIKVSGTRTFTLAGNEVALPFSEYLTADVKHLAAGIYLTEVFTENGVETIKWVKE